MRRFWIFSAILIIGLLTVQSWASIVIFEDSFETSTQGSTPVGWTSSQTGPSSIIVAGNARTGSNAVSFDRGTVVSPGTASITRTIDVTGFSDLVVSWWLRPRNSAETYESSDQFSLSLGFDAGPVTTAFVDAGLIAGYTGMYSGTTLNADSADGRMNSAAYLLYTITLDNTLTAGVSSLTLEFTGAADNEGWVIDDVSVTSIPEPASLVLVGAGSLLMLSRRRK